MKAATRKRIKDRVTSEMLVGLKANLNLEIDNHLKITLYAFLN